MQFLTEFCSDSHFSMRCGKQIKFHIQDLWACDGPKRQPYPPVGNVFWELVGYWLNWCTLYWTCYCSSPIRPRHLLPWGSVCIGCHVPLSSAGKWLSVQLLLLCRTLMLCFGGCKMDHNQTPACSWLSWMNGASVNFERSPPEACERLVTCVCFFFFSLFFSPLLGKAQPTGSAVKWQQTSLPFESAHNTAAVALPFTAILEL